MSFPALDTVTGSLLIGTWARCVFLLLPSWLHFSDLTQLASVHARNHSEFVLISKLRTRRLEAQGAGNARVAC
ncbi:hypothetical protein DFH08DRAFT_235662 [Mycena albidolilacea]|uniref:Uncharacterized protein n=1 Tax=Mycena albidolilacea TaxID=1033008 RepID=A0AAD6ZW71_9AGAR|nr:hypothetical protein DFH08DRAFT_235662 [Mycena albidolilacea]